MEHTENENSHAGAPSGFNDGLEPDKSHETEWNKFWRDSEQKERELFERSYKPHKLTRHHGGTGEYKYRYVEHCWNGWMDRAFLIHTCGGWYLLLDS